MLAVQTNGAKIVTIETSEPTAAVRTLQAAELLERELSPTRQQIRDALSGNYCRCTGYHAIVDAIEAGAALLREGAPKSSGSQ